MLLHEQEEYNKQLAGKLLRENNNDGNLRILAFRSKPPPPPEGFENSRKLLYTQNFASSPTKAKKMFRHIPQVNLLPSFLHASERFDRVVRIERCVRRPFRVKRILSTSNFVWQSPGSGENFGRSRSPRRLLSQSVGLEFDERRGSGSWEHCLPLGRKHQFYRGAYASGRRGSDHQRVLGSGRSPHCRRPEQCRRPAVGFPLPPSG